MAQAAPKQWYVAIDGVKSEPFGHYTDAKDAFSSAQGKHVFLCRGDGTVIDCKDTTAAEVSAGAS